MSVCLMLRDTQFCYQLIHFNSLGDDSKLDSITSTFQCHLVGGHLQSVAALCSFTASWLFHFKVECRELTTKATALSGNYMRTWLKPQSDRSSETLTLHCSCLSQPLIDLYLVGAREVGITNCLRRRLESFRHFSKLTFSVFADFSMFLEHRVRDWALISCFR